jgi:hypothetical protein
VDLQVDPEGTTALVGARYECPGRRDREYIEVSEAITGKVLVAASTVGTCNLRLRGLHAGRWLASVESRTDPGTGQPTTGAEPIGHMTLFGGKVGTPLQWQLLWDGRSERMDHAILDSRAYALSIEDSVGDPGRSVWAYGQWSGSPADTLTSRPLEQGAHGGPLPAADFQAVMVDGAVVFSTKGKLYARYADLYSSNGKLFDEQELGGSGLGYRHLATDGKNLVLFGAVRRDGGPLHECGVVSSPFSASALAPLRFMVPCHSGFAVGCGVAVLGGGRSATLLRLRDGATATLDAPTCADDKSCIGEPVAVSCSEATFARRAAVLVPVRIPLSSFGALTGPAAAPMTGDLVHLFVEAPDAGAADAGKEAGPNP